MELALHGIPGAADGSMTETEFRRWQRYAARHALPMRRLQLQLALVALTVARSVGGGDSTLDDFLFDPPPEDQPDDDAALAAAIRDFG